MLACWVPITAAATQAAWRVRAEPCAARSLGGQTLAALGATSRDHAAAVLCGHAGAEAVAAGALQARWLKGAFHSKSSEHAGRNGRKPDNYSSMTQVVKLKALHP